MFKIERGEILAIIADPESRHGSYFRFNYVGNMLISDAIFARRSTDEKIGYLLEKCTFPDAVWAAQKEVLVLAK